MVPPGRRGRRRYEAQVTSNAQRIVDEQAPRGRILDRNGMVLVDNRQSIVVTVDTQEFAELEQDEQTRLLERLATALNRSRPPNDATNVEALTKRLDDTRFSHFRPVPVAEDITEDQEIYFSEQADRFPAVVVERQTVRTYPYGSLAAHVLGYVGSISEEQFADLRTQRRDKPYEPVRRDRQGRRGGRRTSRPPRHARPAGLRGRRAQPGRCASWTRQRRAPQPGNDVYLAIDVRVQAKTEMSLRQGLEERQGTPGELGMFPAEAGAAAVVDPPNGQVLAMASYPTYDPSTLVGGIECPVWRDLQGLPAEGSCEDIDDEIAAIPAEDRPVSKLVNRAIPGLYPPGSTFKLATAYAGLKLGLITPDTSLVRPGLLQIPGCDGDRCRVSSPSAEQRRHGDRQPQHRPHRVERHLLLQARQRLLGAAQAATAPWARPRSRTRSPSSAIGAKTGIDLGRREGRAAARPRRGSTRSTRTCNGQRPTEAGDWRSGDSINLAIGQGDVLVTPLQMANAYAAFANGGTLYVPSVLDRITAVRPRPTRSRSATSRRSSTTTGLRTPWPTPAMKDGFEGVTQDRPLRHR